MCLIYLVLIKNAKGVVGGLQIDTPDTSLKCLFLSYLIMQFFSDFGLDIVKYNPCVCYLNCFTNMQMQISKNS